MINYLYNNSTWNIEKKNTIWIYDYEYFYVYFNAQKKGKILKKPLSSLFFYLQFCLITY